MAAVTAADESPYTTTSCTTSPSAARSLPEKISNGRISSNRHRDMREIRYHRGGLPGEVKAAAFYP
jgi:hypothetical protein